MNDDDNIVIVKENNFNAYSFLLEEEYLFIDDYFDSVRKKVFNDYGREIAFELMLFENRFFVVELDHFKKVLQNNVSERVYGILAENIKAWEKTGIIDSEGNFYVLGDIKNSQTFFLKAWVDLLINCQEELYTPEKAMKLLTKNKFDTIPSFFYKEPNEFAVNAMDIYHKNHQIIKNQEYRPRFFNYQKTANKRKPKKLIPFVDRSLLFFFRHREHDNRIPVPEDTTIEYLKLTTEKYLLHPAVINYINFQRRMHFLVTKKRTDIIKKISDNFQKSLTNFPDIPQKFAKILDRMLTEKKSLKQLSADDQEYIKRLNKESAKCRLAFRMTIVSKAFLSMEIISETNINITSTIDRLQQASEQFKNALKEAFKDEGGIPVQVLTILISKAKVQTNFPEDKLILQKVMSDLRRKFQDSFSYVFEWKETIQEGTMWADSDEVDEIKLSTIPNIEIRHPEVIDGIISLYKETSGDSLSLSYKLENENTILVLVLPDSSNIILDSEYPVHRMKSGEIISLEESISFREGASGRKSVTDIPIKMDKKNFSIKMIQYKIIQNHKEYL